MADESGCRLDTACKCLELPKPSREDWLSLSDDECTEISSIFRALSDPIRVRIMEMLYRDPLYVCIIQHLLGGIKYSKLSYHLDILKKEGLIDSERQGNFVLYSITPKGSSLAERMMSFGEP